MFYCRYPCLQTTSILLKCGGTVNAFDAVRNTPLHVIASNNFAYNESILNLLCDVGAHIDIVNALGQTPIDLATNLDTKRLLKSRMTLSLKCLCARLIQEKNVSFQGKIGVSLFNFVEKH
jgi:Fem-1 family protein b